METTTVSKPIADTHEHSRSGAVCCIATLAGLLGFFDSALYLGPNVLNVLHASHTQSTVASMQVPGV